MPINIDAEDLLKIIKDSTIQKIFVGILIGVCAFFAGRATMADKDCSVTTLCKTISDDKNRLSAQLEQQRIKCQEEKNEALNDLAEQLEADCIRRIDEAIDHCEFSERIHCPICISRGLCVKP